MLDVLYLEDNHIRKNKFKKDVCILGKKFKLTFEALFSQDKLFNDKE